MRARSPGAGHERGIEHHRDGLHIRIHHRLVFQPRRDPGRLLGWQQIVRGVGLDLDDAVQRVLDLMHLVGVPPGDQPVALVEITAAERPPTAAELDDPAGGFGRCGQKSVRWRRDGHEDRRYYLDMQTDDLILVSIDDHVVEPPDMFLNHVPAKYKAEAPVVVTDEKGVDQWMYQGRPQGVSGLNAVVSWPAEEWGRDPAGFAEMRPGRVRRPRARPGHEPQRHPGVDVLPDVHRVLGPASQHAPRGRHAGDGVGLQRLAHRRVGGQLPGPLHPDRRAADVESGGDVRRDPPGGRQGLPGGHHAGTAAPGRSSELPRRRVLGSGVHARCRKRTW